MISAFIFVVAVVLAFMCGRKYERKQFRRIGKRYPTVQDVVLRK